LSHILDYAESLEVDKRSSLIAQSVNDEEERFKTLAPGVCTKVCVCVGVCKNLCGCVCMRERVGEREREEREKGKACLYDCLVVLSRVNCLLFRSGLTLATFFGFVAELDLTL